MMAEILATKEDPLYEKAKRLVLGARYSSISFVQRMLGVNYVHAARLLSAMEHDGAVGPADPAGKLSIRASRARR